MKTYLTRQRRWRTATHIHQDDCGTVIVPVGTNNRERPRPASAPTQKNARGGNVHVGYTVS